jgi:hypothetical protein
LRDVFDPSSQESSGKNLIPLRKKAAAKQAFDPIQIPEMPAARPKRPS